MSENSLKKEDSILLSIKKLLGVGTEYEVFDTDIVIYINSALSTLTQMGVGPTEGFKIKDENDKWDDFVPEDPRFESIKTYVYLKVKLLFDPPYSSSILESIKETIKEHEWRLNVESELIKEEIQNG